MKKAKGMFKKLGFELIESNNNYILYEQHTEYDKTTIIFGFKPKEICFNSVDFQYGETTSTAVSLDLFSAIEQQKKELGW